MMPRLLHEEFVLLRAAEAHHALNTSAVVPGAVEQDHLAGGAAMGAVSGEPLVL